jgi:hypothetical protein
MHVFLLRNKDVEGRDEPGHDDGGVPKGLVFFILHRN